MDSKRQGTDKGEDLTTLQRRYSFDLRDFVDRIVPSTLTNRRINTVNPRDIFKQTARIFIKDYAIKRSSMIGALAALVERLSHCPESVPESNYYEQIIRRDLKRQIAEKGSGIQEVRSFNRRSYGAMVKSMVIDAEIMDLILETEEGKKEVEKLRAFFAQRTSLRNVNWSTETSLHKQ
ncbi:hypothetical protein EAF00_003428 [Botryotinia globosa]|nr:hypothetical protein EAF00_003428 [Botryotinia globosa]